MSAALRAVLLDVDDTLVDTRAAMRSAAATCARTAWPDLDEGTAGELGIRYHADPGGFFTRYATGEIAFEQMRAERLREVATHHGLAYAPDRLDVFEAAWSDAFRDGIVVFDDVAPFLARCVEQELLVGALTNSSQRFTELKLEKTGLGRAFTAVATRDTLGFGKPDGRAFHRACELLGAEPGETLYVGDDLEVDARAARAAGLVAVWLDRRDEGPAGDLPTVTTLADITLG